MLVTIPAALVTIILQWAGHTDDWDCMRTLVQEHFHEKLTLQGDECAANPGAGYISIWLGALVIVFTGIALFSCRPRSEVSWAGLLLHLLGCLSYSQPPGWGVDTFERVF